MTTTKINRKSNNKVTPISKPLTNAGAVQERSALAAVTPAKRNKITYVPGQLPVEGVVRKPTVLSVTGVSGTTLNNMIRDKIFPPGKLLSARCRVWNVTEIREFLASLEAEVV